jgi:AraC-like DNA-binding protein
LGHRPSRQHTATERSVHSGQQHVPPAAYDTAAACRHRGEAGRLPGEPRGGDQSRRARATGSAGPDNGPAARHRTARLVHPPRRTDPCLVPAYSDPVVGPALRLLHANPAHPWTVAALAAKTGVSRANLGRRFTAMVGHPPMTYLREWRLTLAADLLREPSATLAAVAGRVGFSTAFALSATFKRERGVSPSEYRTAVWSLSSG